MEGGMKMKKTYKFTWGIHEFLATVNPGQSLTLQWGQGNEKTFRIGDPAHYIGSEKFSGVIEKIGPKTVTVRNVFNHRILIHNFALANT
jgi:hypothetical protein